MENTISDRLTGTLAADETGRPLVLCHGTFAEDFAGFTKTRDLGFHFGSLAQATERKYEKARETRRKTVDNWRIVKVALSVRSVLVYPDDPGNWQTWHAVRDISRLVDPDFLNRMRREGITSSQEASRHLRDLLIAQGFDAIAYRNMFESKVGSKAEWSWLVLDSSNIVNLPDGASRVLKDAVGAAPGLKLPAQMADIEGVRGRNGAIRLVRDRRALIAAVGTLAAQNGGELGPAKHPWDKPDDNRYGIDFGDGLTGDMLTSLGRISVDIPQERLGDFDDMVDDFVGYEGFRTSRTTPKLSFEWISGESLADFMARLQGEVSMIKEVLEMEPESRLAVA